MPYTLRRKYRIFFKKFLFLKIFLSFFLRSFVSILFTLSLSYFLRFIVILRRFFVFSLRFNQVSPLINFHIVLIPSIFPFLKNWMLLARIRVLYDQFCINRIYQWFASLNERMYSTEESSSSSTRMNYYVPL